MTAANDLRSRVASAYTGALEEARQSIAPDVAGYVLSDIAGLPSGVAASSFGCGNPVACGEIASGEIVVDLGSGAGMDLLLAARKVGLRGRVIGVDMTAAMIERARANIQASGLGNIEVRQGLIESLPVETASVDWVISNCVLNLSPEKDRVFAEIVRVLKPGGRMLVSDIVVNGLPSWARRGLGLYTACVAGAISEEAFVSGLEKAGLVNIEVRERLVYDADQLAAIARELGSDLMLPSALRRAWVGERLMGMLARMLAGKVWSARFYARKASSAEEAAALFVGHIYA